MCSMLPVDKLNMMFSRANVKTLELGILLIVVLMTTQCAVRNSPALPNDIKGISIGMSKEDAQRRLEEIAAFESEGRKVGQLWKLKNDPHFSSVAVGYDKENRIRFVTAFVEKTATKEKIKFADVGDLTKARAEITEPHYRYIWEVPADGDKAARIVNIYGDNPEFVTMYSLVGKIHSDKTEQP